MEPTPQVIDELFVDKVLAARKQTVEEKFLATGALYLAVIERMRMGILMENGAASESQIADEIRRRIRMARQLEMTANESQ